MGLLVFGVLLLELESEASELSELMSTLVGSYSLLEILRLISSINLDALMLAI